MSSGFQSLSPREEQPGEAPRLLGTGSILHRLSGAARYPGGSQGRVSLGPNPTGREGVSFRRQQ